MAQKFTFPPTSPFDATNLGQRYNWHVITCQSLFTTETKVFSSASTDTCMLVHGHAQCSIYLQIYPLMAPHGENSDIVSSLIDPIVDTFEDTYKMRLLSEIILRWPPVFTPEICINCSREQRKTCTTKCRCLWTIFVS